MSNNFLLTILLCSWNIFWKIMFVSSRIICLTFVIVILLDSLVIETLSTNSSCNITRIVGPNEGNDIEDSTNRWSLIEALTNATNPLHCDVEIIIKPGKYFLKPVNVTMNLILRAELPGTVVVESSSTINSNLPVYTISITNKQLICVEGINFSGGLSAIGVVNVTRVNIKDCMFEYFLEGALNIYNCPIVDVSYCSFSHNGPSAVIKPEMFRGHSGGLSVAYFDILTDEEPQFSINSCTFVNNTADPTQLGNERTTSQAFRQRVFTGRGGALGILLSTTTPVIGIVSNCTFMKNKARSFGGGLYTVQTGLSNHTISVNNSFFSDNFAGTGAGALLAGFINGGNSINSNKLLALNCTFVRNYSPHGGAVKSSIPIRPDSISIPLGNFARFENCTFRENRVPEFGAAIGMFTLNLFGFRELVRPLEIIDCVFIDNNGGSGGIVSTAYFPLIMAGVNTFINNTGPGLQVVGSRAKLEGTLKFVGNNAETATGGALYLQSFGQIQLNEGLKLVFTNNSGKLGSAIVVESQRVTSAFSQLVFNPLCPFQYEKPNIPPISWDNVSIEFQGNRALVGSSVFMNHIDLCSWTQFNYPFFNLLAVFNWHFVSHNGGEINEAHVNSSMDRQWYIQTPASKLEYLTQNITGYAGEIINTTFLALDELSKPTVTAFRFLDQLTNEDQQLDFTPSVVTNEADVQGPVSISFHSHSSASLLQNHKINVESILSVNEVGTELVTHPQSCPPGYILMNVTGQQLVCICDFNDINVAECNSREIILQDHKQLWTGQHKQDNISYLFHFYCLSQYCQCKERSVGLEVKSFCFHVYNSLDPDSQCVCSRQGILCGECKNGTGISALLNNCVTCSDLSAFLIAALVIIDVVLFTLVTMVTFPMPSWIYPSLFWIQVMPYIMEYQPITFDKSYPYLYYIASALGFYFPYDFCLYSNMSALASYTIRFLPLLTAIIVCPTVLLIRHKAVKYKLPWHGLWLITVLLFPHVVYTAASILNCPQLPDDEGNFSARWYINGSIQCFVNGHIGLAVLGLIVFALVTCIVITYLLISLRVIKNTSSTRYVLPALESIMKDKLAVWSVIELLKRFVVVLAVVAFPGNQFPVLFVIMFGLMLYGYKWPYRNQMANVLELILASSAVLLLLVFNTSWIHDTLSSPTLSSVEVDGCIQTIAEGVTNLVAVMTVLYYFPLTIFIISLIGIPAQYMWKRWLKEMFISRRLNQEPTVPTVEVGQVNPVAIYELGMSDDGQFSFKIQSEAVSSDCSYSLYSEQKK